MILPNEEKIDVQCVTAYSQSNLSFISVKSLTACLAVKNRAPCLVIKNRAALYVDPE